MAAEQAGGQWGAGAVVLAGSLQARKRTSPKSKQAWACQCSGTTLQAVVGVLWRLSV